MRPFFFFSLLIWLFTLGVVTHLPAQTQIQPSAFLTFPDEQLRVFNAGSDIPNQLVTGPNDMLIDIYRRNFIQNFFPFEWRIEVSRIDTEWHPDLRLEVRRSGNGQGFYSIPTGGEVYQTIAPTPSLLMEGVGYRVDIPLQFRIRGCSVTLPAKTYQTTILLTLVEP